METLVFDHMPSIVLTPYVAYCTLMAPIKKKTLVHQIMEVLVLTLFWITLGENGT